MSGGRVVHALSGEPYDFYIGRAMNRYGLEKSFWANPYKVGRDGDLPTVLASFEEHVSYLCGRRIIGLDMNEGPRRTSHTLHRVELAKLRGLTLACWCAPKDGTPLTLEEPASARTGEARGEVCHGQVLLRLADEAASDFAS